MTRPITSRVPALCGALDHVTPPPTLSLGAFLGEPARVSRDWQPRTLISRDYGERSRDPESLGPLEMLRQPLYS